MREQRSVIIGVAIVIGCLILSQSFHRQAVGQGGEQPSSGRYHVFVTAPHSNATSDVIVFDSTNGHCWYRSTNLALKGWQDLGTPVQR